MQCAAGSLHPCVCYFDINFRCVRENNLKANITQKEVIKRPNEEIVLQKAVCLQLCTHTGCRNLLTNFLSVENISSFALCFSRDIQPNADTGIYLTFIMSRVALSVPQLDTKHEKLHANSKCTTHRQKV